MSLRRRIEKLEAEGTPVWATLLVVGASTDEPPMPAPRFYLVAPDGEKIEVTRERYAQEVDRCGGPIEVLLPPELTS